MAGKWVQRFELEASLFFKDLILHAIAQVQPTQEVLIAGRNHYRLFVRLQVLDVGLGQRVQVLHLHHKRALALQSRGPPFDRSKFEASLPETRFL